MEDAKKGYQAKLLHWAVKQDCQTGLGDRTVKENCEVEL